MQFQFYDTAIFDGARKTRDGYVVGTAKSARTGIQVYSGREVDPTNAHGLRDRAEVRVWRPAAEVFHADAMQSMAHRPITIQHPPVMVDSRNWKKYGRGNTSDEIARDGQSIRVPLVLMDQEAIDAWEGGMRGLSWGYVSDLDFTPGVVPDGEANAGEAFDVAQRKIRCNHLALCDAGRAGPEYRFDHNPQPEKVPMTKTATFDGLPYETTDAAEAVIAKLKGTLADSAKASEKLITDHAAALGTKDAEIAKLTGELADAKAKIVEGAALDALIAERGVLLDAVKSIAPTLDVKGKSTSEIKRAAVALKLGDEKVKDKADAYVDALFDGLTADPAKADPVRDAILNPAEVKDAEKAVTDARAQMVADMKAGKVAA